jgi:hypothetical protein
MLAIRLEGVPQTIDWHVGESNPVKYFELEDVVVVQADGHELELIASWSGVPIPKDRRVVRWFGDTAKFIVANL